jgi:hypothetical protein
VVNDIDTRLIASWLKDWATAMEATNKVRRTAVSSAIALARIIRSMDEALDGKELTIITEMLVTEWRNDLAAFYMDRYYDGAPDAGPGGGYMDAFGQR